MTNAAQLAAIVPISGANPADINDSKNIAAGNLPVWATHNAGDLEVSAEYTKANVDSINVYATNQNLAFKRIFASTEHDAWTQTYDPTYKENFNGVNLNIYEWMLTHSRSLDDPLPVTFKDFSATYRNSNVHLKWSTSSEENAEYYLVEISTNGIQFREKARVAAANLSNGSSYEYTDANPPEGTAYYRLSQGDKDGRMTTYKTVSVEIRAVDEGALAVWPNPASNFINIKYTSIQNGKLTLSLINSEGKIIKSQSLNKTDRAWQHHLLINDVAPGLYLLNISVGGAASQLKVIKQ